jgi:NAD(P)H-flavin reductase
MFTAERAAGAGMVPVPCRVLRRSRETADCCTLVVEAPGGAADFLPGQFNMLYLFGVGEVPISISGDHRQRDRLVHTTRAVGPVTQAIQELRRGDSVGVRGPFGSAWPLQQAQGRDVLIIGGGLGLAPLRPAIYALLRQRRRYGNITVLYGARSPEELLFRRELSLWRERRGIHVEVTVDCAGRGWHGRVGVVTRLIPQCRFDPASAVALICGPETMMQYAVGELLAAGLGADNVYLSMERNMKCALGLCGHCQLGPLFVCRDGPVLSYARVERLLATREL